MPSLSRRDALALMAAAALPLADWSQQEASAADAAPNAKPMFRLASFRVDVTPPLGHPLLAGWKTKAQKIGDPLFALGAVLLGPESQKPIVLATVDWCEIRNDAYDLWRDALAEAAGTTRERVLLSSVHQHDAPYTDITAQKLLDEAGLPGAMFDVDFQAKTVRSVADSIRKSLESTQPITQLGIGSAKIDKVASSRRIELAGKPPNFSRYSFTRDPQIRDADDGVIDPLLRTISFWNGDQPIAALSSYAVHPMSYYGQGEVSTDFVGLARSIRQREEPGVFQMYFSGCSGDTTAGKYNDGTPDGRKQLAERLRAGMAEAWKGTRRVPLTQAAFRIVPLRFQPETGGKLSEENLKKTVADTKAEGRVRSEAALGLSWLTRCARGQAIDLPVVDFGPAVFVLAPAEAFVAYQLAASQLRPDSLVMTAGYGECAPGYIPTEKTRQEGFVKEHGYCWVAAESEKVLLDGLKEALKQP